MKADKKAIIAQMIRLYCKGNHSGVNVPCESCQALLDYALSRLEKCPFREASLFCSRCPVHCYSPEKREEIRKVMGYAGPRLLLHHPFLVIQHGLKQEASKFSKRKRS